MKRNIIFIVSISLITIIGLAINAEMSESALIKTFHTLDFYNRNNDDKYIDLIFAPIGWSKDGKFAYIKEIATGGADYYETGLFRWVVQDMITDKILWISDKEEEGDYPAQYWEMDKEELFHWMLKKFMAKNWQKIEEYGIIVDTNIEIQRFPLVHNNAEYRGFLMDIVRGTQYGFHNMIIEYKNCVSKDDIIKVVGHIKEECLVDVQIGAFLY